jgi:hypothetical protein
MFNQCYLSRHAVFQVRLTPRRVVIALVVVVLAFPVMGCYRTKIYRGDGKIVKVRVGNWLLNCDRYKVSLGSIDFTKKGRKAFTMQGLPHEEMCLGFQTKLSDQNATAEDNKSDALVKVVLVDEAGRIVIHEEERLSQWTWSGEFFVYHRGHDRDEGREILKVADEGRGTYFKPRTKVKYTLTVEIAEPDSKGRYDNAELEVANLCSVE